MTKSPGLLALAFRLSLAAVLATACTVEAEDKRASQQEPERKTWSLRILTLDWSHSVYTLTDDGRQKHKVAPDSKLVGNLLVETTRDAIVTTDPATGEQVYEVLLDDAFHPYRLYLPFTDFCPAISTAFFVDPVWLYRHGPGERTSRVLYIGETGSDPIFGASKLLAISPDGATVAVIRSSPDRPEDITALDRYGDVFIYDLERKTELDVMHGEQCFWLSNDVLAVTDQSDEIISRQWQLKLWSREKGVFFEETIDWMTLAIGQGEFGIIESGEKLLLHRRSLDGSAIGSLTLPDSVKLPSRGITYYAIRKELRAGG